MGTKQWLPPAKLHVVPCERISRGDFTTVLVVNSKELRTTFVYPSACSQIVLGAIGLSSCVMLFTFHIACVSRLSSNYSTPYAYVHSNDSLIQCNSSRHPWRTKVDTLSVMAKEINKKRKLPSDQFHPRPDGIRLLFATTPRCSSACASIFLAQLRLKLRLPSNNNVDQVEFFCC